MRFLFLYQNWQVEFLDGTFFDVSTDSEAAAHFSLNSESFWKNRSVLKNKRYKGELTSSVR